MSSNGAGGGLLKGPTDKNGGPGIVAQAPGSTVILGGGEVIINENAVNSNSKKNFKGKQLTNCEILSEINQETGGVAIPCNDKAGANTSARMEDGGSVPDDFDWDALYNSPNPDPEPEKTIEQEREELYQQSHFSKKWAASYKEAKEKLLSEHKQALEEYEDWASRRYKQNKDTVFVGPGELEGGEYSKGYINESRRKKRLMGFQMTIDETRQDLNSLGLSNEEIDAELNKMEEGGLVAMDETPMDFAEGGVIDLTEESFNWSEKTPYYIIVQEDGEEEERFEWYSKKGVADFIKKCPKSKTLSVFYSHYRTDGEAISLKEFAAGGPIKEPMPRPLHLWHLTKHEFIQYCAHHAKGDHRLAGFGKTEERCGNYYKYDIVKPLLHDSAERNLFLLAVESGQLPYDKVEEIIRSADAWDENNRFVKALQQYNREWTRVTGRGRARNKVKALITLLSDKDVVKAGKIITSGSDRHLDSAGQMAAHIKDLSQYARRQMQAYMARIGMSQEAWEALTPVERLREDAEWRKSPEYNDWMAEEEKASGTTPPSTGSGTNQENFVKRLIEDANNSVTYNKVKLEKLAKDFHILDQNTAKELAELSIALMAREIAHSGKDPEYAYKTLVKLYEKQVNMSHRTSESMLKQQYSTPAPIGYLMGLYCQLDKGVEYFEPSAGNGLLITAGNVDKGTVNEIDDQRSRNLKYQEFATQLKQDATEPFKGFAKKFDAVLTNPPFGKAETSVDYDGYKIESLEQVMALRALDCMKDNGRAAIIIGGHQEYDSLGRIKAGKNRIFFSYLFSHYNLDDVINIDGHKLYSRQGTGFNTRLILINGRKAKAEGFPPLITGNPDLMQAFSPEPVRDFPTLYYRVSKYF